MNLSVIPGRAPREPGISQGNIEIPGLRLEAHPGMTGNDEAGSQGRQV
jgi:hypothetical protein